MKHLDAVGSFAAEMWIGSGRLSASAAPGVLEQPHQFLQDLDSTSRLLSVFAKLLKGGRLSSKAPLLAKSPGLDVATSAVFTQGGLRKSLQQCLVAAAQRRKSCKSSSCFRRLPRVLDARVHASDRTVDRCC